MRRAFLPPRGVWLAILVGLSVRIAVVALVEYRIDVGDAAGYDRIATNVVERGVFSLDAAAPYKPTLSRPPLVPMVAAASYSVFGRTLWPIQLLQIVASLGTALLVYGALRRAAPEIAWTAYVLVLLSPFDALYTGALLTEAFAGFFLAASVCLPLYSFRGRWAVAGACAGAAALTRDVYMLLPFALAGAIVLGLTVGPAQPRRRVASAGALLLGAVLVVAPWTVRNFLVSGQIVPISKGVMGVNLWVGSWERNGKWQTSTAPAFPEEAVRFGGRKLVEAMWSAPDPVRDPVYMRLAKQHYREQPGAVLRAWVTRYPRMWLGTRYELFSFRPAVLAPGQPLWLAVKGGLFLLNAAVLLAGLVGGVILVRRRSSLLWLAIPVVYNALIYIPFHNTETRYTQPVYPLLLILTSAACVAALNRWRRGRPRPADAGLRAGVR